MTEVRDPAELDGAVDVLIRTVGRETLSRAIGSALAQAGPPVRVVVLAAHGQALPHGIAMLDDSRVEVVVAERPLARAAAANRLLELARAEFALFLDDDDWLLAGHLARLVAALREHPEAVAAHAGVRCVVHANGEERVVHVYDDDVDPVGMQLANQLPIHSTLWRLRAQREPELLTFDESLEHFEDWDFWLGLMQRGPFVRVPGVSAVYALDAQQGSRHAERDDPKRRERLAAFGRRQLGRWRGEDVADLIDAHAALRGQVDDATQRLAAQVEATRDLLRGLDAQRRETETVAAELDAQRRETETVVAQMHAYRREAEHLNQVREQLLQQVAALEAHRAALLASTSWRVTKPLRAVGRALAWVRGGGVRTLLANAASAARAEWRRHGVGGVVRRLPYYARHARRLTRRLTATAPAVGVNPFAVPLPPPGSPVRLHPELLAEPPTIDRSVSVVIPTFNAGREFAPLLRKLRAQRGVREVELVVVDSGSRDDTVAVARAAGATLVQITQAEFSHSHARNLGADAARGDLLLFMVQDAYPIGDLWIHGMLHWLLDHAGEGVVAASCSEYCRSDSDLMYESMVATHYRFLGCAERDRIGRFTTGDHMALRSQGQLSDVACLIDRDLFQRYRYRGDYAEDLDLGIRLIRDGHAVAMLASVKVVHSHRRPAWYYLRRTFVDVVFLVRVFDDFEIVRCPSAHALVAAVLRGAGALAAWLQHARAPEATWMLESFGPREVLRAPPGSETSLGEPALDAFLQRLRDDLGTHALGDPKAGEPFTDMLVGRIDHVHQYALSVYEVADGRVRREFADAVLKTFAGSAGAALAFLYLNRRAAAADDGERVWIDGLFEQLKAGI